MDYSRNQIKKAGKKARNKLAEGEEVDVSDLEKIQSHRIAHQVVLKKTFEALHEKCCRMNKGNIVVYRLKRLDTIIRKLVRQPRNQVTTMQDIAGCRAILRSEGQIKQVVEFFENSNHFDVIDQDNYIQNPADSGYRSHHIIVKPVDEDKLVEIQLRTEQMHLWATLVEITDLLFDVKVKEGQDHPQLHRFHQLLSKEVTKLTFDEKTEIVKIEKELDIVKRMVRLFKSNYVDSVLTWVDSMPTKEEWEGFLFMEVNDKFKPSFEFFTRFYIAEEKYFQKFTLDEPNMVLVRIVDTDFNKVGLAYSNYVLTNHPSVRKFVEILIQYVQNKRRKKSDKLGEYYLYALELISDLSNSFDEELDSMIKLIESKKVVGEEKVKFLKSWRDDSIERLTWIREMDKEIKFHKPYDNDLHSYWRRFSNWLNDR